MKKIINILSILMLSIFILIVLFGCNNYNKPQQTDNL